MNFFRFSSLVSSVNRGDRAGEDRGFKPDESSVNATLEKGSRSEAFTSKVFTTRLPHSGNFNVPIISSSCCASEKNSGS